MSKFRAKARAIDLLGKGQIADLPTAITELWKNGYDAYADNIQCDLYIKGYKNLSDNIFTLSDDGIGMSKNDVEEKWIVLGTDSKTRRIGLSEEERTGKPKRPIMGEKGIGRLSVSYLGSQMILITKKKNEKSVCLFIDWRILDNYNLYLDDIDIDICTLESKNDLYNKHKQIIEGFKRNLYNGDWTEHEELRETILGDLNSLELTNNFILEELMNIDNQEKSGTTFLIFNPHEQIMELEQSIMNEENDNFVVNDLRTSLMGFYNLFKEKADFDTHFYIHDERGKYDIIESMNFFSREEMFSADHWLKGNFDENGYFTGEVKIYNKIVKHTFRPTRIPGETPYGPFELCFGFLEGDKSKSILPEEKWLYLFKKLNLYGGLYIYRDGIRVLPYGRQSSDFLRFEERRSHRAGTYFFSYRRMMGYIGISRERNPKLIDKAGREGFITNNAYRAFVDNLTEFFIDLALRFFANNDNETTMRQEQINDVIRKNKKLLENETKKSKKTIANFKNELMVNDPKVELIVEEIKELNEQLRVTYEEEELIYNKVNVLSSNLENKRIELRKLKIDKPQRGNLTSRQEKKYFEYNEKLKIASNIIKESDDLLEKIKPRLSEENLQEEFKNRYSQYKGDVKVSLANYNNRFSIASKYLENQFKNEKYSAEFLFDEKTKDLLNSIDVVNGKDELKEKTELLKNIYEEAKEEILDKFEPFIKHIEQFSFDVDEELLVGIYKEEYKKMKEKMDQLHELSQLGMTIEIIDHQFNVLYSQISDSLRFFAELAKNKNDVRVMYNQLNVAFQHLEYNHKLLTPLYRTSRRTKTEISGEDIGNYIERFFGGTFLKENINFEISEGFKQYKFYSFESIVNPVFINIINNAIYWLTSVEKRNIVIDLIENKIAIMNSGAQIHPLDIEKIFELFVTKKPGGRGIGLYLAKTNLRTIDYDIYATNDRKFNRLNGACFVIHKLEG